MIVRCDCKNCINYDDAECGICGIVKDGLDTLQIGDDAECLNYEPESEDDAK